jgi:mersacidin/lichenicidin family type 2 lantibiotic
MPIDIVRAWTDEMYRRSLSPDVLAQLPEHPSGQIELLDADLAAICGGGSGPTTKFSLVCSGDCLKSSYCFTFGPCC